MRWDTTPALAKLRERGCVATRAECLGDRLLPSRERLAQSIGKGRLALGCYLPDRLGIAHAALAQTPKHLGRQGRERLPVGRLLEALDARGGLQHAASAELLHGFEPVMAALLQQARDLQLQLGIGFVEMDWQFVAHCSALRSWWAPFGAGVGHP